MRQHWHATVGCSVARRRLMPSLVVGLALAVGCVAATDARAQGLHRSCGIQVTRTSSAGDERRGGAVVRGTVTDASARPLDATIMIPFLGIGTNTDANGKGSFVIPSDRVPLVPLLIAVRRIGYEALQVRVQVAPGDTITLAASLCSAEPVTVHRPVGSPGSPCLGPDRISDSDIWRLRRLVRSSDSLEADFRRLVHIPVVPDSMIGLVTDGRICKGVVRAWAAADSTLGAPPPYVTDLYVIRIGPVFVATVPPVGRAIGYRQYVVYDSRFAVLAPFLW